MGPCLPGPTVAAKKGWKNLGMLKSIVGGVGNGVAEEGSRWDLKPTRGSHVGQPHDFGAPFTVRLRKQERQCRTRDRDNARPCREESGERALAVGA